MAVKSSATADPSENQETLSPPRPPFNDVPGAVLGAAIRRPDRPAVIDAAGVASYAELAGRARRAAATIARLVPAGAPVPVAVDRGRDFIAAALGAMLAGCPYLPLDRGTPLTRRRGIYEQTQPALVVADHGDSTEHVPHEATVVSPNELVSGDPPAPVPDRPRTAAYVIYTSGSTGAPKGVVVSHAALWNLVAWHNGAYGVDPATRSLHTASLSFDAAVWEIWPYLAAGATVVTAPDDVRISPARLVEFARAADVSILFAATPLAEEILALGDDEDIPWNVLLTGGDSLHVPRVPSGWTLLNHYGPTEAAVVTTACEVATVPPDGLPPIGRPIDGVAAVVCDPATLAEVPPGTEGELLIGGRGLALGYYRDPGQTAARFVPIPGRGGRWYRSGDLVVSDANGLLWYRGRVDDDQLKIRGARLEAAEVEAALTRHPRIRHAAVAAIGRSSARRSIGAVIVPEGAPPSVRDLRKFLLAHVPAPAVPTRVVSTDRIPVTVNGKVDRREIAKRLEVDGGGST